jgi:hypothetical protein
MTFPDPAYESEADEMMNEIIAESESGISPTVTPFVSLGSDDPAMELIDGPTTPEQAQASDLWQTFRQT